MSAATGTEAQRPKSPFTGTTFHAPVVIFLDSFSETKEGVIGGEHFTTSTLAAKQLKANTNGSRLLVVKCSPPMTPSLVSLKLSRNIT
ncbi:MAG: hypothetical protein AAGL17_07960, partial [Cyanobacteria bacterium J06576_12]